MRVQITEDRLKTGDPATGQHYNQVKDDVITVPDDLGRAWCDRGWVRDLAPENPYPSAERKPGVQELVVHKATVGAKGRVK